MKMRTKTLLATLLAAALVSGCNQRVEVPASPCDLLGKTDDPKQQAELKERCGHGGPEFKPTPKTRQF